MKKIAVLMMLAGSLMAAEPTWLHNLDEAKAQARREHKLIFCDLWTGWCGWCIKLQKDTFPSPEAQEVLGRMVPVSIMTQDRAGTPTEHHHLERTYNVTGFPTLLVLDAEGHELDRQPGYLPPAQFREWLSGVLRKYDKR